MNTFEFQEADQILKSLNAKLRQDCEKEIDNWLPGGDDRFFESFALWCETTCGGRYQHRFSGADYQ